MRQLYCRGWLEENTGAKAQVDEVLQFVSDQAAAFIGRYSLKLWHANRLISQNSAAGNTVVQIEWIVLKARIAFA